MSCGSHWQCKVGPLNINMINQAYQLSRVPVEHTATQAVCYDGLEVTSSCMLTSLHIVVSYSSEAETF